MVKLRNNTDILAQPSATLNDLNALQESLKHAETLQIPPEQLGDSRNVEEKFKNHVDKVSCPKRINRKTKVKVKLNHLGIVRVKISIVTVVTLKTKPVW